MGSQLKRSSFEVPGSSPPLAASAQPNRKRNYSGKYKMGLLVLILTFKH